MNDREVTYHARFDEESDEVLVLFRLRSEAGGLHGERYAPGSRWVADHYAFDVMRNGQDYDVVDEEEAAELAKRLDGRSGEES